MTIAIVGMGGIFPGAKTVSLFWENILAKKDLSRDLPEDRFSLEDILAEDNIIIEEDDEGLTT